MDNVLNLYNGNSKVIKRLPISYKLIIIILGEKANETNTSSDILCYFGIVKENNESYHMFLDLETMAPKYVTLLEFGNFCRENSIVSLDEIISYIIQKNLIN